MHILDAVALLGLPLPAAPHNSVDLWRAGTGPLQFTALCDALDCLGPRETEEGTVGGQEKKAAGDPIGYTVNPSIFSCPDTEKWEWLQLDSEDSRPMEDLPGG